VDGQCVPYQRLHCDRKENGASKLSLTAAIGIVATQPNSAEPSATIRIIKGSHRYTDEDYRFPEFLHLLELNRYQVFVGHPDLWHSGSSATSRSCRAHFYVDIPMSDFADKHGEQLTTIRTEVELTQRAEILKNAQAKSAAERRRRNPEIKLKEMREKAAERRRLARESK
jgi:hypothetical protein